MLRAAPILQSGRNLNCCLGQTVDLSDELVDDARMTAERAERSIAGQIEFWALGGAIEPSLDGSRSLAPRRSGPTVPLSHLLATGDSAEDVNVSPST